jgi:hypothetical protein
VVGADRRDQHGLFLVVTTLGLEDFGGEFEVVDDHVVAAEDLGE